MKLCRKRRLKNAKKWKSRRIRSSRMRTDLLLTVRLLAHTAGWGCILRGSAYFWEVHTLRGYILPWDASVCYPDGCTPLDTPISWMHPSPGCTTWMHLNSTTPICTPDAPLGAPLPIALWDGYTPYPIALCAVTSEASQWNTKSYLILDYGHYFSLL